MSAEQWHVVVPLSPEQEEWIPAFAAAILEVDPDVDADRAQAAMRECFRVPRQREPEPACWRCKDSREIPSGRGHGPGDRDYTPCPECDPEA